MQSEINIVNEQRDVVSGNDIIDNPVRFKGLWKDASGGQHFLLVIENCVWHATGVAPYYYWTYANHRLDRQYVRCEPGSTITFKQD